MCLKLKYKKILNTKKIFIKSSANLLLFLTRAALKLSNEEVIPRFVYQLRKMDENGQILC